MNVVWYRIPVYPPVPTHSNGLPCPHACCRGYRLLPVVQYAHRTYGSLPISDSWQPTEHGIPSCCTEDHEDPVVRVLWWAEVERSFAALSAEVAAHNELLDGRLWIEAELGAVVIRPTLEEMWTVASLMELIGDADIRKLAPGTRRSLLFREQEKVRLRVERERQERAARDRAQAQAAWAREAEEQRHDRERGGAHAHVAGDQQHRRRRPPNKRAGAALSPQHAQFYETYGMTVQRALAAIQKENKISSAKSTRRRKLPLCLRILGLDVNCTADDINKAYRLHAKNYHPDLSGDATGLLFILIGEAKTAAMTMVAAR